MKLKNSEIVRIVTAYQKGTDLKLPPVLAWKRRLNMKELVRVKGIVDEALAEARRGFLDAEHAKDLGNGSWEILPEFQEQFILAQEEILGQETDVNVEVVKINLSDLGKDGISDSDLETLAFMVDVSDTTES